MIQPPVQKELLFNLWQQVLPGDENALSRIHAILYNELFNYASHMLDDAALADDAIQEIFIKAWTRRLHIGVVDNVKAYFFTMLRRHNINQLKSLKLQAIRINNSYEPDMSFSPEDIIVSREQEAALQSRLQLLLNQLPRRQKEVVYLKYYDNLNYEEIGQIMDINYQSVINLVFKAIQFLKKAAQ